MSWDTFRIQKRQALARSWLAGVSPSPFSFFIRLKNEKELPIFTAAAHHLLKITTPSAPRLKKKFQVLPRWAKAKNLLLRLLPKFLAPTNFYLMRGHCKNSRQLLHSAPSGTCSGQCWLFQLRNGNPLPPAGALRMLFSPSADLLPLRSRLIAMRDRLGTCQLSTGPAFRFLPSHLRFYLLLPDHLVGRLNEQPSKTQTHM